MNYTDQLIELPDDKNISQKFTKEIRRLVQNYDCSRMKDQKM